MPRLGRMRAKPSVITLADRARDACQWKRAAGYYREALRRNPQNPPIWVQYGHVLKESGHLIEAERAYRTAVAYGLCNADSHLQLGHVLKIQGKNEDARAAYFRAIALDPSLDGASFEMAEIGWSKAHFSELRGMLFMDMAGPMALASVHGTSGEHPLDPGESEDARLISQSGLFDAAWYLEKNKDLQSTAVDPLVHYLRSGAREGRDPHPLFDSDWYLATNQDVAASDVNPLVHYLRSGVAEGRAPNPVLQSVFTRAAGHRVLPTTRKEVYSPDLFELRGLVPHGRIAVVLHLYYPDLWAELRQAIERISEPFDLFVSLVKGASEHMRTSVKQVFPNAYIFDFENRGRDIGPFLVLIQSGVLFQYELVCKLHTKRSPHREDGDEWRGTLIGGILGSPSEIDLIISSFRSNLTSAWSSPTEIFIGDTITGLRTRGYSSNCCYALESRLMFEIAPFRGDRFFGSDRCCCARWLVRALASRISSPSL